ncbi:MAG TPA: hypothetical protein DDX72_10830 [Ruminococcaceae bacterium]|nr:hypothetical protein [Oscillospiraceae bacterium]
MKTDVYRFERAVSDLDGITEIAEKAASYSRLDEDQELKLMLLCEELIEMLPNLLLYGKGEFWIETKDKDFEIHSVVEADDLLTGTDRKDILKISKSGKNAAAVGVMSKIKAVAETLLANYALSNGVSGEVEYETDPLEFYDYGITDPFAQQDMWSLTTYKKKVKANTEGWDELERSIIANLADDVTVGILGGKVMITVKKKF